MFERGSVTASPRSPGGLARTHPRLARRPSRGHAAPRHVSGTPSGDCTLGQGRRGARWHLGQHRLPTTCVAPVDRQAVGPKSSGLLRCATPASPAFDGAQCVAEKHEGDETPEQQRQCDHLPPFARTSVTRRQPVRVVRLIADSQWLGGVRSPWDSASKSCSASSQSCSTWAGKNPRFSAL